MACKTITAYACTCDVCGLTWTAATLPARCRRQSCKSRAWNKTQPLPPANQPDQAPTKPPAPAAQVQQHPTKPRALDVIAQRLAIPRSVTTKCPHDFANWLICPTCNPKH